MNKKETLILGAGNPLRRDDGIGVEIIKLLSIDQNRYRLPPEVDFVDGGTDGPGLIEYLKEYKKVILIDAVEMGLPAGTVKTFSPDEALIRIQKDSLSTHGFGIAELLKLAKELNITPELTIIGIQPENIGMGMGLSNTVRSRIDEIIAKVSGLISAHTPADNR